MSIAAMEPMPILRVARPTSDLKKIREFYEQGLGLQVIAEFKDHDGFDGVMLGRRGSPYHFEFTVQHGHVAPMSPSKDHLVVFYIPDKAQYQELTQRMESAGFKSVPSLNPYWDQQGKTYQDFENYRVVISNTRWGI